MQSSLFGNSLGEGKVVEEPGEGDTTDKRKPLVLARIYQGKMQAKVYQNNAVLDSHEEIEVETTEENNTASEEDCQEGKAPGRESTCRCQIGDCH